MRAILTGLFLIVFSAPAMAERGGDRQKLDTDGDGYVTPEEFSQSRLSERVEFSDIDADGDNLLTADEIRSHMRAKRGDRGRRQNPS